MDTPRHGNLPFTEEAVFGANYHTLHVCERHGIALHCIDVPATFSVHPLPAGALGDQQTLGVHESTQNPFLHSLFVSMTRTISCALLLTHETEVPSFLPSFTDVIPFFLFFFLRVGGLLLKPRDANWYFRKTLFLSHLNNVKTEQIFQTKSI